MATSIGGQTPILASHQQHAALFLYSHAAAVMAIAGAVSFVVSAFFGYNCLFPATVTGLCFCAWAGTVFSQTPQQVAWNQKFRDELLSSLARIVRKYLDSVLEAHTVARQKDSQPISSKSAKDGAVPAQDLRTRPVPEWVEIKRWPPVTRYFYENPPSLIAVQAFTNQVDLKYVAVNLPTQDTQSGNIQINGSLKETIEFLKNCFVTLEDDGSPVFSLSYHTFSGTYESKTLRADLLLRQKDCFWNIYDTTREISICTHFVELSPRCSTAATEFFENSHRCQSSLRDQIQCIKEFVLHKIFPFQLHLEPIHHTSGFGEGILVSKFMWATTLIRYQGPSGNHAQIIIEGINDGFFAEIPIGHYFVYLADLMGAAEIVETTTGYGAEKRVIGKAQVREVKSGIDKVRDGMERRIIELWGIVTEVREIRVIRTDLKTEFNIKYEGRSETWKRPSSSVKDMIRAIVKERDDPPPGFSILGRHSIFTSSDVVQDSCITWAISKLALIGIVLKTGESFVFYTDTSAFARFKPGEKVPCIVTLDPRRDDTIDKWLESTRNQFSCSL